MIELLVGEHPKCEKKDIYVYCEEDKEHWGWKRDEVEGEMEMVKRNGYGNNGNGNGNGNGKGKGNQCQCQDCDQEYPYKNCYVSECSLFSYLPFLGPMLCWWFLCLGLWWLVTPLDFDCRFLFVECRSHDYC